MERPAAEVDVTRPCVLGHSKRELDRLIAQARLIDPIARRFFLDAGIGAGMPVLDLRSGDGDVAILAAEPRGPMRARLLGPTSLRLPWLSHEASDEHR